MFLLDLDREPLEETARTIGANVVTHVGDVREPDAVRDAFRRLDDALGGVDVLVNSAGVYEEQPFLVVEEKDWERTVSVNLDGTFLVSQMAARRMTRDGGGSIVHLSSTAGRTGDTAPISVYAASKGGVLGITRQMAAELGPLGIRVNAVLPGPIETRMVKIAKANPGFDPWVRDFVPMKRCGRPEEVADVLLFLASDDASYVTGALIPIDGGSLAL